MKLVANIKLQPTTEQFQALKETLERCNAACDYLSAKGFEADILRTFDLHKLGYADIRERFGLAAQVAIRCIAKTADAYKLDKKVQRTFRKHAAQPYDDRIVSFKPRDIVSIWTLAGRLKIQSVMGKRQRELLAFRKGEVDLMFVRGKFYVVCVCDVDDESFVQELAREIDTDRAWLAGVLDGEGYLGIPYVRSGKTSYRPVVSVAMCSEPVIKRIQQVANCGSVCSEASRNGSGRQVWRWSASTQDAADVARMCLPYLVGKRRQAELLITMGELNAARKTSRPLDPEEISVREALRNEAMSLNFGNGSPE